MILNESVRITPAKMLILGVGWLGVQFFWGFHISAMPLFLNDLLDSKVKISIVLSLAGVAGCIVPPIAGYFSDRTSGRFGRRRPYIFFGLLCVLISLFFLPRETMFLTITLVSGAMYFGLRFAETPYLSLLPDITPPEQRGTASGAMNLLGSLGLISFFVISYFTEKSNVWENNPAGAFYMVGIVAFVAALVPILTIREPEVPQGDGGGAQGKSPLEYLKGIAKETSAMRFFTAQFFWWLGFMIVSSWVVLFVVEELKATEADSFKVLGVFSVVMTLFVLPLGMLGDRFGRKRLLSLMIGLWVVSEIIVGFSQNLTQALYLVGLTAIPFAAIMGVGFAFMLDLIPKDRTAEFVGFSIISIAVAQVMGPIIGGVLIESLGYRSIFPATAGFMFVGLILLQFVQPREEEQAVEEN